VRKHSGQVQSRRELFTGALRFATLGHRTNGGAALFAKRERLVSQGKCVNDGICAGCKVLEQCGLPEALSAKKVLAGVDNGGK
jgi:hypothetical protein